MFLEKADKVQPTGGLGPCSQILVEFELLIYFFDFVCIILNILCSLLCLSVFRVWSLSLDYIHLISARIPWLLLLCFDLVVFRKKSFLFCINQSAVSARTSKKKQKKQGVHINKYKTKRYNPILTPNCMYM